MPGKVFNEGSVRLFFLVFWAITRRGKLRDHKPADLLRNEHQPELTGFERARKLING
jgi:hypothetical protein